MIGEYMAGGARNSHSIRPLISVDQLKQANSAEAICVYFVMLLKH
jgi:hypothetical protein